MCLGKLCLFVTQPKGEIELASWLLACLNNIGHKPCTIYTNGENGVSVIVEELQK